VDITVSLKVILMTDDRAYTARLQDASGLVLSDTTNDLAKARRLLMLPSWRTRAC